MIIVIENLISNVRVPDVFGPFAEEPRLLSAR
jgi:hypothetical protein